jgi:hypothetical protein
MSAFVLLTVASTPGGKQPIASRSTKRDAKE